MEFAKTATHLVPFARTLQSQAVSPVLRVDIHREDIAPSALLDNISPKTTVVSSLVKMTEPQMTSEESAATTA